MARIEFKDRELTVAEMPLKEWLGLPGSMANPAIWMEAGGSLADGPEGIWTGGIVPQSRGKAYDFALDAYRREGRLVWVVELTRHAHPSSPRLSIFRVTRTPVDTSIHETMARLESWEGSGDKGYVQIA